MTWRVMDILIYFVGGFILWLNCNVIVGVISCYDWFFSVINHFLPININHDTTKENHDTTKENPSPNTPYPKLTTHSCRTPPAHHTHLPTSLRTPSSSHSLFPKLRIAVCRTAEKQYNPSYVDLQLRIKVNSCKALLKKYCGKEGKGVVRE